MDTTVSFAKEKFRKFLNLKGLSWTRQRELVFNFVFETTQHVTAEFVVERLRHRDRRVSRATTYRVLQLLTESDVVREVDFGTGLKYYDPNFVRRPNHCHVICQDCGRILEFENARIETLARSACRDLEFRLVSHDVQLKARCEKLRRERSCPHWKRS